MNEALQAMKCLWSQSIVLALLLLAVPLVRAEDADIVINEIMYHPPDDLEAMEYIELYNSGGTPVDLSGWKFTKGIGYTFPAGTVIQPDDYLVVCRMLDEFRVVYGEDITALGDFKKSLSNKGERITDYDIQWLKRIHTESRNNQYLIERNPDYARVYTRSVSLFAEITAKALENEKAGR